MKTGSGSFHGPRSSTGPGTGEFGRRADVRGPLCWRTGWVAPPTDGDLVLADVRLHAQAPRGADELAELTDAPTRVFRRKRSGKKQGRRSTAGPKRSAEPRGPKYRHAETGPGRTGRPDTIDPETIDSEHLNPLALRVRTGRVVPLTSTPNLARTTSRGRDVFRPAQQPWRVLSGRRARCKSETTLTESG